MNISVARAADGLPRRAFTVDDIHRMMKSGIFGEDERFELIEGGFVRMWPPAVGAAPYHTFVSVEGTIQLAHDILVEPDLAVISKSVYDVAPDTFAQPRPEDVLLLIEVAASSMRYDRSIKARLYARHGIREFWVIDAKRCITWIHTGSSGDGWTSIVERGPKETLTTTALPNFAIPRRDEIRQASRAPTKR